MDRISWWESFFNQSMSGRERDALNQAAVEIEAHNDNLVFQAQRITKLKKVVDQQAHEIEQLKTVLKVVVDTLQGSEAVDGKVLGYRIEAALAALEPPGAVPTDAPASGGPMRSPGGPAVAPGAAAASPAAAPTGAPQAVAKPVPQEKTTTCVGCGTQVPLGGTNVTELGYLCDSCFSRRPGY